MFGRRRMTMVASIAVLAFAGAGCGSQAGQVRRYSGTPVTANPVLAKGGVTVTNRNGSVWVDTAGRAGNVEVIALPFASGADDAAAEQAAAAAMSTLSFQAVPDGNGGVAVNGSGDATSGFDIMVHLPYPFGGSLTIDSTNGYVHYVGSSGANGATVNVETGDIFVQDGGKVLNIKGGQSNINVIALPTLQGSSITTDYGNITAQIPDSANILITASTGGGGTVTPPPNRSVEATGDDDDSTTSSFGGFVLKTLAVSTVADDHKSAQIQLGDAMKIMTLMQYLTVSTGHGNIVFH
jgi:hypothetical protein